MKLIAGLLLVFCMFFSKALPDLMTGSFNQPQAQTTQTMQTESGSETSDAPVWTNKHKGAIAVLVAVFFVNGFMIYRNYKKRKSM